jgi:hypothetical protein
MKYYTFRDCTVELLEDTFGLQQTAKSSVLTDWFKRSKKTKILSVERQTILRFQQSLIANLLGWNEQELALNFIGPLISCIQFTSHKYNLFAERSIDETVRSLQNEDIKLSGKPDTLIASGHRSPKVPYFSFHEHKPETDGGGDPTGQVLAAMLVGQTKNIKADDPIYGCYVIGQNWYFLVLENKNYTIASPFAATSDEIFDIYRIVKTLKDIVAEKVEIVYPTI